MYYGVFFSIQTILYKPEEVLVRSENFDDSKQSKDSADLYILLWVGVIRPVLCVVRRGASCVVLRP